MTRPPVGLVLITADTTFATLFRHALDTREDLVLHDAVIPDQALETVRRHGPAHVVVDTDGQAAANVVRLCRKLLLVRPVGVVLTGAYLGLGSAALTHILEAVPARSVMKPGGCAGLALADETTAARFADALVRALGCGTEAA